MMEVIKKNENNLKGRECNLINSFNLSPKLEKLEILETDPTCITQNDDEDQVTSSSPEHAEIDPDSLNYDGIETTSPISFKMLERSAKYREYEGEEIKVPEIPKTPEIPKVPPITPEIEECIKRSLPILHKLRRHEYTFCQIAKRTIFPPPSMKKTLILDLDNTLIHTCVEEEILFEGENILCSRRFRIPYIKRPYLDIFLKNIEKYYEIWVYSAGETDYVNDILTSVDPHQLHFRGGLTVLNCAFCKMRGGIYPMKNLSVITNRNKEDIVIVDDTIHAWPDNLHNLVPVPSFYGDAKDNALERVENVLMGLYREFDVRTKLQTIIPLVDTIDQMMKV